VIAELGAFMLIGGGIKYIDDAFDEGIHSRKLAAALAPLVLLVWLWVSARDSHAATLLAAVLLGVLLSGKIDNAVFALSSLVILLGMFMLAREIMLLPLAVLTAMAVLDERGNDLADAGRLPFFLIPVFAYRMVMKLGVLVLGILEMLPMVYFLVFLGFDLAYEAVGRAGVHLSSQRRGLPSAG